MVIPYPNPDSLRLQAGETRQVELWVKPTSIAVVFPPVTATADVYEDTRHIEKGTVEVAVGGGQPGYTAGVLAAPYRVRATAALHACG